MYFRAIFTKLSYFVELDTATHTLLSALDMTITPPTSEIFASIDVASWSIDYGLAASLDVALEFEASFSAESIHSAISTSSVSFTSLGSLQKIVFYP